MVDHFPSSRLPSRTLSSCWLTSIFLLLVEKQKKELQWRWLIVHLFESQEDLDEVIIIRPSMTCDHTHSRIKARILQRALGRTLSRMLGSKDSSHDQAGWCILSGRVESGYTVKGILYFWSIES